MAVVYLARDLRHVRDVAVKIFRLESEEPGEGSQRFLQEIQIAARLSHPNILPLHDSGEAEGLLYYVMPYVPGETLRQRMDREGALPVADSLRIARDIADALAYAHSHGVIHRDIKPENILFISDHAVVADFGIARAISAGGWEEWKLAGPAGTPTYMSPEQARGGSRVDGRSDVYSLGCVLYEMLTGEPPFRGSTPEEVVVQHLESEPLPVHTRRPALTPELQAAVGKALAKHPADRYQTAQQMADALAQLQAPVPADRAGASVRAGAGAAAGSTGSWIRRWVGPAAAALGIAAATIWTMAARGTKLDPALVYVGPLVHREGVPVDFGSEQCSRLIYDAVSQWKDIRVADRLWTGDQLARLDHPATLDDLLSIARRIRAGRLLSGEVYTWGDSVRVRGILYDVAHGPEPIGEHIVVLPAGDLALAEQRLSELADSLLLPRPHEAAAATGIAGTRTISAWQAYDSAHGALADWDLADAAAQFRTAVARDPHYAMAHLWLAQTLNWMGEDASSWRDDIAAALEPGSGLPAGERVGGEALLALADGRYQDACRQYDTMVKRDTLDFQGWYGRGECRRMDRAVLRDPTSPSKWRFRASYHSATRDYERALSVIPLSHRAFRGAAFDRLQRLFITETNNLRLGFGGGADTGSYGAFPSLVGDSLAFVPYPMAEFVHNEGGAFPVSTPQAVSRNRERLTRVTANWARAFPNSSAAQDAYGRALELQGVLDGPDTTRPSALAVYRRARAASTDTALRVLASVDQVRVLVKLGRYVEARILSDSLLRLPAQTTEAAGMLASLATLTGRPLLAASLARRAAPDVVFTTTEGQEVRLPPAIGENAMGYLALASMQAPADSMRAVDRRLLSQVETLIPRSERSRVINAAFAIPRALAYPVLGPAMTYQGTIGANLMLMLQQDMQRGDTAGVRDRLAIRTRASRQVLYSELPLDLLLREAQLRVQIGDTTGARAELDKMLSALPDAGLGLAGDLPHISLPQSAALPLSLAMMADLMAYKGDSAAAGRFAAGALGLLENAEPPLHAVVNHLRSLSRPVPPQ